MKDLEWLVNAFKNATNSITNKDETNEVTQTVRVSIQTDWPPQIINRSTEDDDSSKEDDAECEELLQRVPMARNVAPNWSQIAITQDKVQEFEHMPRYRTQYQKQWHGDIPIDVMLSIIKLSSATFTSRCLGPHWLHLRLICKFAGAVMDDDTGNMLE
jgi:hypothetical protein